MTNLVQELRLKAAMRRTLFAEKSRKPDKFGQLLEKAANEIERLEAEIERQRYINRPMGEW